MFLFISIKINRKLIAIKFCLHISNWKFQLETIHGSKRQLQLSKTVSVDRLKSFLNEFQLIANAYRIDVGLLGGRAGLVLPFKPYGVRGVSGKAGVSGRGEPAVDVSASVSERYEENDSSRTCCIEMKWNC